MSYTIGVLIFVVAIVVSVMAHEAGHMLTAKAFGMKVTRYFVGFGNTVWSRRRGETEYGIKSIPLGGFVDIVGMSSMDMVDPADEPRAFRSKPAWQRSIVLAAGSVTHFLIALLLLAFLAIGVGVEHYQTTKITLVPCIPANAQAVSCPAGAPPSPAKQAGLRTGDQILAVDGHKVSDWNQLVAQIRKHSGGLPVIFSVSRGGRVFTARVTLAALSFRSGGYLGVEQTAVFTRTGLPGAVSYAGSEFGQAVTGTVSSIVKRPSELANLFSSNRSKNGGGLTSVVGVSEVTGQVVSAAGVSWQQKLSTVLLIVASVNIFVGLFNLLPFLPLDGGKLVVVIFEGIRSWLARLRGRPDPGMVDMRRLMPVMAVFLVLIVTYSVLLIAADIFNPIHLTQ